MCKITEELIKSAVIDAAIKAALYLNATTEQIVQILVGKYELSRDEALQWIEDFKNDPQTA